jgi:hypothetical protein
MAEEWEDDMKKKKIESRAATELEARKKQLTHKHVADELALRWVHWSATRVLLAPQVKSNVLARVISPGGTWHEPDAEMDADMPFFNMAVHALCDQGVHVSEAVCFLGVYWYSSCIKALAQEQECARGTIYNRARAFSKRAMLLGKTIRNVHDSMTSEKCSTFVERNSSCGC